MEGKKTNLLLVFTGVVIVVAVIASFGMGLFVPDTAKIVLPTPTPSGQPEDSPNVGDGLVRVEVTPQTVQNVIRTLARPESYYREVTVTDFWGDGEGDQGVTHAQVWVDGGWTMTRAAWPGGVVRCSTVGGQQLWPRHEGGQSVLSGQADEYSADLEGQRIPTYEDVLALDPESIVETGYVERETLPCIYVETAPNAVGGWERYWVSVDSGLLVCAERGREEQVLYRMTAYAVERPAPEGEPFALPDGTVLHTAGAANPDPTPEASPA